MCLTKGCILESDYIEELSKLKNHQASVLIVLLCVLVSITGIFGGCKSTEPIQIVGVYNGPGLNTPGGATITITLKNISTKPIVYLLATITLEPDNSVAPFEFVFKVDSLNPLEPDMTISQTQILIRGGFNTDDHYPLDVRGIYQGNGTFQFSQQVVISIIPASANPT
jgi:hypothetical protein